ncbi:adenine phosphoribosyltransferase [Kineosphaera limosa]|uniref:Adenine phosphoribosyltransferase n=1 Tax=Kineosphaera limosa NBRC 100340 TaxID=1184609 RepID=K6W6L7_9MICO|nr:adenine phosphoribosyltransferase [Kineosphaera limosa]NYD98860.1 adenine phosphoribosyltransferase [Kineosphaera limosa]GAB94815.1 adenine phosphoribosyltransferase [Kineosphaera limosa NBRC 100340]
MDRDALAALIASRLRDVPDFPKPGVVFKDFTPLLADPVAMRAIVDDAVARYSGEVDVIAGIEARGFMIGTAVAVALGVPFVPIRKKGKLPAATFTASYDLEYGTETIEVHQDSCREGQRVLVMDDVLATGGTAAAACELIERTGAQVVALDVVCEIGFLRGRERLGGHRVRSLLSI